MVLNPYKANDGQRPRMTDPYYSTSTVGASGQKSVFSGWLSTRNMIIILMVCITIVSYVFHAHHSIAIDPNQSPDSPKLRGKGTIPIIPSTPTINTSGELAPPMSRTIKPTWKPSTAPTLQPTTIKPTLSPTTLTPTVAPSTLTPTYSPVKTEKPTIAATIVDLRKTELLGNDHNLGSPVESLTEKKEEVKYFQPEIVNKDSEQLIHHSIPDTPDTADKVNTEPIPSVEDVSEHSSNSRSAYLSLLDSMKNRQALKKQQQQQVPPVHEDLLHAEEKKQFFPPHRSPQIAESPVGNLQVPPQQATSSDGMIPFDPTLIQQQNSNFVTGQETDTEVFQPPSRMKYDLPYNLQKKLKMATNTTVSATGSMEKTDHCKAQVDPFASQPVESFVPPKDAPFSKVLEWQTEVKNLLKTVGKMRVGGDKLRQHLQEEVNRLRVKRFNTFCEYV